LQSAIIEGTRQPFIYGKLSGFGQEFELLSKNDYIFNISTKKFVK